MRDIISGLEEMAHLMRGTLDQSKMKEVIQKVRDSIPDLKTQMDKDSQVLLAQLDAELSTWQTKSEIILKEPVGREGIAKHVRYWVEKLQKIN